MRDDILEKKDEILEWIKLGYSKAAISKILQCKQETLNSYLKKMGIEYKGRQDYNKGKTSKQYITAEEYSKKDCVHSDVLKKKMLRDGIKEHRCERCGLTEWNGLPIPLELHHIDGNHYNNDLNNLQILCPNCHAQTSTNSGKNIKKTEKVIPKKICPICGKNEINQNSKMCLECSHIMSRVTERPDRETLKTLIRTLPFTQLSKDFGVSDNAIRKWCDAYNLPRKKTDIKSYSDEEWEKI